MNKPYFGIDIDSEFMHRLESLIYNWDICLTDNIEELQEHYLAMWELAQAALKEITGLEFHFTRTNSYYGVCTEDEEFLIKVEREGNKLETWESAKSKANETYSEFKVIVNYPETEEGMKKLEESHAAGVLETLHNILTPSQLDLLMKNLEKRVKEP